MTRRLIAGAGIVLAAYGAFLLLSRQDLDQLVSAALWLASGVVLHDAVLAPLVIGGVALATRFVPVPARAPLMIALVVLGTVTLVAVPVLGRFGARADNSTLLDRPYLASWFVLLALCAALVVVAARLRGRAARPRPQPQPQDES